MKKKANLHLKLKEWLGHVAVDKTTACTYVELAVENSLKYYIKHMTLFQTS